ncbi:conserved hypothetical protein [Hyphomicrobiales bacterium]|nr:conserved hypothetical protein [Hyphomicrobiales bacterium]CAH1669753.1 conserved hypothetical protein [Hyphomicrobiales bacterium]
MSASPARQARPTPRRARQPHKPDEAIRTFVRILEQLEAGAAGLARGSQQPARAGR